MFNNFFLFENRGVCTIMRKNIVGSGQATDDNMAHVHCMLDTHIYQQTHSEYVILVAIPLQQWL